MTGKITSTKTTINPENCNADMLSWPEFHNGVASGLKVFSPHWCNQSKKFSSSYDILSTWVLYNKPSNWNASHAGLLMALGLNGLL